ncbi:MAG: S9 family peptidase [Acidobacteriaceae bacterium]|nr:S9 family peptidase [Acidobacteriaceae bacterium]
MRRRTCSGLSTCAWVVLGITPACPQSPKIDSVLKQLEQVQSFEDVTISPDGQRVSWAQPARTGERNTNIYVLEWKRPSAKPERIKVNASEEFYREHGAAWSPDSSQLAFLANATAEGDEQVYIWSVRGGKPHQLTHLKGYMTDIRWSPDGRRLAVLYAENGGGGGPLEAVPPQTGVIGSDIHNQRIAVVDLGNGSMHQVSPSELNVYEFDWSPDARRFAALAAPGPGDNNWWTAKLYEGSIEAGEMHSVYDPPADRQLAVPRWSPDGKRIAFIGGLMSDAGFNGGNIFVIQSEGGEARDLTEGRNSSPSGLLWHSDRELVFTESVDGGSAISTLNADTGETETLWKGSEGIHYAGNFPNFSLAKDGKTSAVVRSSWERAPEVWAGPIGNWKQLTESNASQQPHWGKAESVLWDDEGSRVQGWLVYPENFDPAKRYPMVVEIHGGPAGLKTASWPSARFDMSVMAGLGYFVFFPNPRGSYGEGEAFTKANVKDFGHGDLRDILAGVDTVLKKVPIDLNRIGVTGWSYGGFMTMWTVTQTNRFRAAVAGAGIANWKSYYGENSIDEWMIPYFGASVYDDPAVYAKSSPIEFIKQVKTPTLVVVGERDGECPAPQSFEFWHALKALNVPTGLVVYPGEGHAFHDPKDRVDVLRRTLAWFDRYLGQPGENAPITGQ